MREQIVRLMQVPFSEADIAQRKAQLALQFDNMESARHIVALTVKLRPVMQERRGVVVYLVVTLRLLVSLKQ